MTQPQLIDALLGQAEHCTALGSPFTAQLCQVVAANITGQGAVEHHIVNWPGDTSNRADAVPLRLAGALHALVLQGRDSALQAAYPPHRCDDAALWNAIHHALDRHAAFILDWLKSPPQTNEVRRAVALIPGFHVLADQHDLPFVTSELGASGGLNLGWDHFALHINGQVWGPADSPVQLSPEWTGTNPPRQSICIIDRAGCDLNPLDAGIAADNLRLRAYLWADQPERMARTQGAMEVQQRHGIPKVARMDALDFLRARLSARHVGAWHVIYHSIMWQYLPKAAQEAGSALIAAAGKRASHDTPLAWLRMEGDGAAPDAAPGAALTLTTWPNGESRTLARVDFHGRWVTWAGA